MEIVGEKNLRLIKKALLSHLVYCSHHYLRSSDTIAKERWQPEIDDTNNMLNAVELNLKRIAPEDQNTDDLIMKKQILEIEK